MERQAGNRPAGPPLTDRIGFIDLLRLGLASWMIALVELLVPNRRRFDDATNHITVGADALITEIRKDYP